MFTQLQTVRNSLTQLSTSKWVSLVRHLSLWPGQEAGHSSSALVWCFLEPSLLHNWLVTISFHQIFPFFPNQREFPFIKFGFDLAFKCFQPRWQLPLLCMHTGTLLESMELGGDGQELSGSTALLHTFLLTFSSFSSAWDSQEVHGTTCSRTRFWTISILFILFICL